MSKTFFSYSRVDSAFVLKLAKDLRDAGVAIWLDQLDIKGGTRWDSAIEDALKSAPNMIIVLSPASVESENVMDEVSFALESDKAVIPILKEVCDTPFRLRRLQHIDFTGDYQTGLQRLLDVLNQIQDSPEDNKVAADKVLAQPVAPDGNTTAAGTEEQKENELWQEATKANVVSAYKRYVRETTTGNHTEEARRKIQQLEELQRNRQLENLQDNNQRTAAPATAKATTGRSKKGWLIAAGVVIGVVLVFAVALLSGSSESPKTAGNNSDTTQTASNSTAIPGKPQEQESDSKLHLGSLYQGGIVFQIDDNGQHGLIVDPDTYNYQVGEDFCSVLKADLDTYKLGGATGWRVPDIEELRLLFAAKDSIDGLFTSKSIGKNLYVSAPDKDCKVIKKDLISGKESELSKIVASDNFRIIRSF